MKTFISALLAIAAEASVGYGGYGKQAFLPQGYGAAYDYTGLSGHRYGKHHDHA